MQMIVRRFLLASAMVPTGPLLAQTANSDPNPTQQPVVITPEEQPIATPAETPPPFEAVKTSPENGGLADIVVTAQRRSENLQNVPVAVTAVSADTLKQTGSTSIEDLKSLAPGLNITTTGGAYVLPRIRGVGTTAGGAGIENPVAVYVDGVYYASATGALLSLNNVLQVAVLKGPQGTLFGRNATGGLIQITTRDPQQNLEIDVEGTYGNKDTIGGSLYATGGLTDAVSADVAVYYRNQREGFGVNRVTGQDVNKTRNFAVRSKIKVELGPNTNLRFSGDFATNRSALVAFRPVSGTIPIGGVPFSSGKFDVESNFQPLASTKQGGGSVILEHKLPGVRVSSITAYRKTKSLYNIDSDKRPQPFNDISVLQRDRQFSQELQLVSAVAGPLQWTAGGYYFSATGAYDPITIVLNGVTRITLPAEQTTRSLAGYAQGSYALTPALKVTAGLRYTHDKQHFEGTQTLTTPAFSRVTASGSDTSSNGKVTWRLAADYRFSNEALGYLSYNRGFKSGGYNPQAFPAVPFEPEVLDAYEIGFKTDLADRRVRINPSFFYYDYKNLQVSAFRDGVLTISNAANAEIYGLDVDAVAAVTQRFRITGGLSVLHARYKNFNGASISTPLPAGGNAITSGSAGGNRLTNTPDWTANLGADYRVKLGDNELQLHADYYYNDGWYPEADNRIRQSNYSLYNASIAYILSNNYSVRLWGRNLGNKAYALQMNSQTVGDAIGLAPGRTFGITLGGKFE